MENKESLPVKELKKRKFLPFAIVGFITLVTLSVGIIYALATDSEVAAKEAEIANEQNNTDSDDDIEITDQEDEVITEDAEQTLGENRQIEFLGLPRSEMEYEEWYIPEGACGDPNSPDNFPYERYHLNRQQTNRGLVTVFTDPAMQFDQFSDLVKESHMAVNSLFNNKESSDLDTIKTATSGRMIGGGQCGGNRPPDGLIFEKNYPRADDAVFIFEYLNNSFAVKPSEARISTVIFMKIDDQLGRIDYWDTQVNSKGDLLVDFLTNPAALNDCTTPEGYFDKVDETDCIRNAVVENLDDEKVNALFDRVIAEYQLI